MRVSFIVPVYNSAKYINNCINSILNQGLGEDDYEIILVNDGSTDASLGLCTEYSQLHNNIRVFTQENSGVSSARNRGLANAQGKYVCFVDSDDYLTSNCISSILDEIGDSNAQLIRFWMIILEEGEAAPFYQKGTINFEGNAFEYVTRFGFDSYCVSFLYDRQWLLESKTKFESYKMAEDYLFISKLLLLNPSVISTTYLAYNYVKHSSSATGNRSPEHSAVCANDLVSVVDSIMTYAGSFDIDEDIIGILAKSAQGKMRAYISRVLSSNISVEEFQQMNRRLKELSILPVYEKSRGVKYKSISIGINFISTFPFLLVPLRFLYVHIFLPFIMKYLSKN